MAFTGLSIMTHGWHHPGLVEVVVDEVPMIPSVVEVRPTIRANVLPPSISQETPVILSAEELRPVMKARTPTTPSTVKPVIVDTDEIRPIIRKVEEE